MDNNATASPDPESSSRRRSGRVVRAPEKFSPEPQPAIKRKRGTDVDDDDLENEEPDLDENMSDEDDESADDDAAPSRSRTKKSSQAGGARKPAIKKFKTNGVGPNSGAHAANLPSRPKKSVRIDAAGRHGEGLFADVFGSGSNPDDIAEQWHVRYQADDALAVMELVNFILQCTGCEHQITEDDIRDPDNCQNRLIDLQNLYQEERITEYPLISKAKSNRSFRELLTGFFKSLIHVIHETDVLYKDDSLMENLHRWIASMSTSTLRPFRHTATTVILSLVTGLVGVARTLDNRITSIEQQITAGKKGKNKAKLAEMQRNLDEANSNRELVGHHIKDFFDTTFIHRYRDIDSRIRTECVEALGTWILQLPTVFMEPEYLRYLGWMLSDVVYSTRQEVLKQLTRIFKRDVQQLGHFIDRFRPRLIEMATKDSEVPVRVAAISVIDTLRATGMLEPDEIDAIGKLIFDSDIRIRKAVVSFFVACVQDSIDSKLEDLGGSEALEEVFGVTEDDEFEAPRTEWINIKCLAENLAAYDAQVEEEQQNDIPHGLDVAADVLQATVPDTRISLASQVLFEKVPEVKRWEMLAGYLLFDHTTSSKSRSRSKSKANNTEAAVKNAVAPDGSEEAILLEVLASAVKMTLFQPHDAEKGKKRGGRSDVADAQEETALELATTIPRLLNKFGADPATATVVLRMEHVLDLEVFQQLRQDASKYEELLEEISTQFNRHDDKRVLAEATNALLHARKYDELEELADSKLSVLWENVINSLRNFDKTCELSVRGNLGEAHISDLSTVLMKISKLASISDCVDILEAEGRSADSTSSIIEILANIVQRGTFEQPDEDLDDLEDEVASFAIKCCQFYFMWKIRSLSKLIEIGADIPDSDANTLSALRRTYQNNLIRTLSSRAVIDEIRLFATGSLCDLHTLFASLRSWIEQSGVPVSGPSRTATKYKRLSTLVHEIEPQLVPELISIFDGTERNYAKRTKKTLNEPADDEDPIDDELLEDDDEDEELTKEERYALELKSEKALCELAGKLVLAITAKVLDQTGPHAGKLRKRLLRNQLKLGPSFKETVSYLDEEKVMAFLQGKKKNLRAKSALEKPGAKKPAQSEEMVLADDDEEENPFEDIDPEEGSREDLRRRELLGEEDEEEDVEEDQPRHDVDEDDVLGD